MDKRNIVCQRPGNPRGIFLTMSCVLHIRTQGIVICSLIFLEDVLKEGDCDEDGEPGLVAFELLNLFVVH